MSISAGTAYLDVRPDMKNFGSAVQQESKGIFGGLSKHLGGIIAGVFATKAIFDFTKDITGAAEQAAAANRKSFALIAGDADAAKIHFDKLTSWAEDFGNSIGQDDEAITNLAAKLTQSVDLNKLFGGTIGAQAGLEQMTQTIVDMSSAIDKPQKMVQKLFNTIANDPKAGISQLLKLGVITQQQADQFKKMADKGDSATVSVALLNAASAKYQGAAAAGSTASERLGAVWENLKETLGAFLLPLFEKLVGFVSEAILAFQGLLQGGAKTDGMFAAIGRAIAPVIQIVQQLWTLFKDDLLAVWSAIVKVYNDNLKPALSNLLQAFNALKPVLLFLVKTYVIFEVIIWKIALKVLPVVIRVLGFLIQVLARVILGVANVIAFLGRLIASAAHVVGAVLGWFGRLLGFFRDLPGKLANAGSHMWDWLMDSAKSALNAVIGLINQGIAFINKFQIHIHLDPPGPGSINFDWNGPGIPAIPTLQQGGIVRQTGWAVVHEGEVFSGVGHGGAGGRAEIVITNWETGRGFMRWVAADEDRKTRAFNARLERMHR